MRLETKRVPAAPPLLAKTAFADRALRCGDAGMSSSMVASAMVRAGTALANGRNIVDLRANASGKSRRSARFRMIRAGRLSLHLSLAP